MGFLQSYLSLPRYQRVVIGLAGVAVGWYGPELMSKLFLREGKAREISQAHVIDSAAASSDRN